MIIRFPGDKIGHLVRHIKSLEEGTNAKIYIDEVPDCRNPHTNGRAEITGTAENSKRAMLALMDNLITIHMQESRIVTIYVPNECRTHKNDIIHVQNMIGADAIGMEPRCVSRESLHPTCKDPSQLEGKEVEGTGLLMRHPRNDPGCKRHGRFLDDVESPHH